MARELRNSPVHNKGNIRVKAPQITFQEVVTVFRRRKKLFFLPAFFVLGVCVVGALLLPRKYASFTTIMVQKDEVLNPLVSFTMAVTMASEDRLKTFNEIVYSTNAIGMLIDSLELGTTETEEERQKLIEDIKKDILTERPGSATFRISCLDVEPVRAQQKALLLANYFMKKVLQVENQRNEMAVEFFEKKLEELRQKYEAGQHEMVSLLRSRIQEMPTESRVVSSRLEDVEREMVELDGEAKVYQQALTMLRKFPQALHTSEGKQLLFEIERQNLPHVGELRPLVSKYDDYTRRYTEHYPEVQTLHKQILGILSIMRNSLETEIAELRKDRWEYERRRSQIVEELKRLSVTQQLDKETESNLGLYRGLYDEMKVRLEQARTVRDLGMRGREQFIIIDPPLVPTEPSKPNRLLIISAGACFGVVLGLFAVAAAELLDSRIKTARDITIYKKRVIAYIHEGPMPRTSSMD